MQKFDPIEMKKELRKLLGRDILFFVDREGGEVNRMGILFPQNKYPAPAEFAQKAEQNPEQTKQEVYKYGFRTGKDLKATGFDVNLAPNAEIQPQFGSHHLHSRCYSKDPQKVRELSDAFATGLYDAGVQPCYKHAIGLSAAKDDPHRKISIITKTISELKTNEMVPFENAYKYSNYLMVGQAIYTNIDKDNVSIYSPKFYEFIRKELKFDGIIITDALNMNAADKTLDMGTKINMALNAGADVVIATADRPDTWDFQTRIADIRNIPKKKVYDFKRKIKKN